MEGGEYNKRLASKRPLEQEEKKKEERKNTAVFVSGLPEDTSLDELVEYFAKYGVIMEDMFSGGLRVKLYENEEGVFKGEALIVYLKEESAIMAADLLNESYFRPDVLIAVERAKFEPGAQKPEDRKIDKKSWKHHMQQMTKKLEWTANDLMSPEEEAQLKAELRQREKYQRIVVLRGMFTEKDTADVKFALDLKEDLLEECEKLGEVTAVHVLVSLLTCTIKFREKEAAAICLKIMNGRYFDGRKISAVLYDGSFSLKEGKEDKADEERLEQFGEWLESAEQ
ncbi:hypothetical protein PSACC_03112 [Paramicrosporidium saccamoebae]|uniref:RRM domain-containing protein n=1 Tax=Paramicrosporidium saccamoebae TaxID=1246581 RepID=A0A2H9TH20_9FUNG|nr:hypothetical protein PSACC_03112 [Paramicrosporidium saccamoebae]